MLDVLLQTSSRLTHRWSFLIERGRAGPRRYADDHGPGRRRPVTSEQRAKARRSHNKTILNGLVHGQRRSLLGSGQVSVTQLCRPGELSVGGGAGRVGGLVPGWRPVRRRRAGWYRGGRVGRGGGTGPASWSGGRCHALRGSAAPNGPGVRPRGRRRGRTGPAADCSAGPGAGCQQVGVFSSPAAESCTPQAPKSVRDSSCTSAPARWSGSICGGTRPDDRRPPVGKLTASV